MPDSAVPLSLDPREPPPTSTPRSTSRPPTRSYTPHSSRPVSPHPTPSHLTLPGRTRSPDHGSNPSSPSSPSAYSGSFMHSAREEGEDSSIFERDVEVAVPLSLGSSTASIGPPTTATAAPPSPTASPLGAARSTHLHAAPAHQHQPVMRGASVTDRAFPTVLDDAVEALTSSSQGGGDVFVVSASQAPSRDQSPSRFRYEPRETSPDVRERDRREKGLSLRGQADKLLHATSDDHLQPVSPPRSSPESEGFFLHSASLEGRLSSLSPSVSPRPGNSPLQSPRLPSAALSPHSPSSLPPSSAASGSPGLHKLSFISPQELITSPPLSTQSLSSITSGASLLPSAGSGAAGGAGDGQDIWSMSSQSASPARVEGVPSDEWERGGLGKGLEERLEELAVREKGGAGAA